MAQVAIPDRLLIRPVAVGDDALRRLAYRDPDSFPVLFDSAARGPLSRYSVLAAYPQAALWQDAGGRLHASGMPPPSGSGFLAALEAAVRRDGCGRRAGEEPDAPTEARGLAAGPFRGGWVVFLGYELAAEIEPRLHLAPRVQADAAAPAAFALRIPAGLVYDHVERQAWMFAQAGREDLLAALAAALAALPAGGSQATTAGGIRVDVEEEAPHYFRARVEAALDYIRAGDIYQANLSRPWRGVLSPRAVIERGDAGTVRAPAGGESGAVCGPGAVPGLAAAEFLTRAPGAGRWPACGDPANRRYPGAQRRSGCGVARRSQR
jgi:anthranilate/para-aminobenzoate synthase component I